MRIVSLLPSATELLCAIPGGAELLVGRSHECNAPAGVERLPVLTAQRTGGAGGSAQIDRQVRAARAAGESLYTLDEALLRDLAPDVILTQDLCDVCSIDLPTVRRVAASMSPPPRVVSLNPSSLEDVFDDLITVGEAVGLHLEARQAMIGLRDRYESARDHANPYADGPEVAFLEWMDPLFVGGHWTPQLIKRAGGRHSLNPPGARSRIITPEELLASQPDRIIICPCGYTLVQTRRELPALRSHPCWKDLPATQRGRVVLVDGDSMFNRPGPRLVDAFCWLVGWINDRADLIPDDFPVEGLERSLPAHPQAMRAAER